MSEPNPNVYACDEVRNVQRLHHDLFTEEFGNCRSANSWTNKPSASRRFIGLATWLEFWSMLGQRQTDTISRIFAALR